MNTQAFINLTRAVNCEINVQVNGQDNSIHVQPGGSQMLNGFRPGKNEVQLTLAPIESGELLFQGSLKVEGNIIFNTPSQISSRNPEQFYLQYYIQEPNPQPSPCPPWGGWGYGTPVFCWTPPQFYWCWTPTPRRCC